MCRPMVHLLWLLALGPVACSGVVVIDAAQLVPGCVSDTSCASGQMCQNGRCVDRPPICSAATPSGTCPGSLQCDAGVCIPPGQSWCDCLPAQGCVDAQCVDVTDTTKCAPSRQDGACAGGESCIGGACVPCLAASACSSVRPAGCCPGGAVCDAGVCVAPSASPDALCDAGHPNGLCPSGDQCKNATCQAVPCSIAAPTGYCPIDQVCRDGVCAPLPCGPYHLNGHCPDGQFCSAAGACTPAGTCLALQDCNGGQICSVTHVCLSLGTCAADGDCAAHFVCNSGSCVRDPTCSSDADCLSSEHCSVDGVCLPQGQCHATADCPSGQKCATAGQCIPLAACLDNSDCTAPDTCGSQGMCISPGSCNVNADCLPGRTCDLSTHSCSVTTACTFNAAVGSCPAGQTCCSEGHRCSAPGGCPTTTPATGCDGACISVGQCIVGENDCLTPDFTCVNGRCVQATHCLANSDCSSGEYCNTLGACVPTGQCSQTADCPPGDVCNALFACQTGQNCGSQTFQATLVEPNMLVVLDRSGSMADQVGATCSATPSAYNAAWANNTRWDIACDSLASVVTNNDGKVRFGLSTFPYLCPGSPDCGVSSCGDVCNDSCDWTARCGAFSDQATCNAYPPCKWQACLTTALCGYSSRSTCNADNHCIWRNQRCNPNPGWCGSYSDATTCGADAGCAWNASVCAPRDSTITSGGNVAPGNVDVPVGDLHAAAIIAALSPQTTCTVSADCPAGRTCDTTSGMCVTVAGVSPQNPGGNTPTGRTLRTIAVDPGRFGLPEPTDPQKAQRDNYILLMTDGAANGDGGLYGVCDTVPLKYRQGSTSAEARVNCALDYLAHATPPIETFVVGFVGGSINDLNCAAVWGQTSLCGTPQQCAASTTQIDCEGCTWNGSTCSGASGCAALSSAAACQGAGLPGCTWDSTTSTCGGGVTTTNCANAPARPDGSTATCFYNAQNATELSAAFASIAGSVASCSYTLDQPVQNTSLLYVSAVYGGSGCTGATQAACGGITGCTWNGTICTNAKVRLGQAANAAAGWWAYDSVLGKLTLYGKACDDVKSGAATPEVVYGCSAAGG